MNDPQKIKILEAKVASLEKNLKLKGIEKRLKMLKELDKNITDVVEDFEKSYKLASQDSFSEIKVNQSLVKKTKEAVQITEGTKIYLEELLKSNPRDKTIIRMLKDSEVLLKRFERNLEQSKKIVNRLSKRMLPVELKKSHSSLSRKIKSILVNPKDLKIRYSATDGWYEDVMVSVVYSLPHKGYHDNRAEYKNIFSLKQMIGTTEVEARFEVNNIYEVKGNVKTFFEKFKEEMDGQEVIKGGSELIKIRLEVAKEITPIVDHIAKKTGDTYGRGATVSDNGVLIEGSTRTSYDYADYGQYEEPDFPEYYKILEKELERRGLMKHVKSVYGDYGEKGWYYFYVQLK